MFGRLSWCASAKRRGSAWAEARCSLDFSLGSHKRERTRELARESRPRPVSPPAGHAHRAHCGTTRFLILSRLAEGGHFREMCLPPPPPRSFPSRAGNSFLVAALSSAVESQCPPSSRRRPPRSSSTSTHPNPRRASTTSPSTRWTPRSPLPARGFAAAGCAQAMPPRRSNSSARAPLVCASLTSEATLHRRGRAPPRRGTKVILTDLRKHDDLNGEVGFIVFKPDDRFDGRPVPRPPARPPGHRLRQGIKPARRHVRTLRRAPLHPRARRSVTLRSAPRAARAGASTTTRSSRSSTASSRSSD